MYVSMLALSSCLNCSDFDKSGIECMHLACMHLVVPGDIKLAFSMTENKYESQKI